MSKYKICEKCGAHLDHGEKCDCTDASMIGSEEHRSRIEAVREEIADVQIMLDRMRILYGDPVEAENGKLERLEKRLKGGGA